ncbi:hypothetical protein CEXT_672021 [Caerostris extrusa]|uniref:Uncharacterized protein n=1 Tax=Caerostris extrusa TaxID=172846 RepID=A0AAV4RPR2_CAEEX|nr:hypothetical protein CEXT_672021 [Caerostris extrusa]
MAMVCTTVTGYKRALSLCSQPPSNSRRGGSRGRAPDCRSVMWARRTRFDSCCSWSRTDSSLWRTPWTGFSQEKRKNTTTSTKELKIAPTTWDLEQSGIADTLKPVTPQCTRSGEINNNNKHKIKKPSHPHLTTTNQSWKTQNSERDTQDAGKSIASFFVLGRGIVGIHLQTVACKQKDNVLTFTSLMN